MDHTFIIYHYRSFQEEDLIETVNSYRKQVGADKAYEIEILIVLDGVAMSQLTRLEELVMSDTGHLRVIPSNDSFTGPGGCWNEGLKVARGEWVTFTWTGAPWYEDSLSHLIRVGEKGQGAAYGPACYEEISTRMSYVPQMVGLAEIANQTIEYSNSIPLCYMVIKKDIACRLQGFKEEVELARIADWEFVLRLVKSFSVEAWMGKMVRIKKAIGYTDFDYPFRTSVDEQIRTMIMHTPPQARYKVAIIAGLSEGAQVQLCLLNYFEISKSSQTYSWRRFVENEVIPEEIEDYDLVFFIRSKTVKALEVAKFCLQKGIRTTYVLDDNWFCLTDTYPQLETQIGKQSISYFYFILLISVMDEVWVYSDKVKEDMKKYNTSITQMPVNVNLSHFMKQSEKEDDLIHIGFAGSSSKMEYLPPVFQALERIMREFEDVRLYFKGIALPATFNEFSDRVVQGIYSLDYKEYAEQVGQWHYDIMVSPLGNTRYTNSKCINKYLEITAAQAAGIYTDIPLYQSVVTDGVNGLLVDNQEEEWYKALTTLIRDKELRKRIIEKAQEDIKAHYETSARVEGFSKHIEAMMQNQKQKVIADKEKTVKNQASSSDEKSDESRIKRWLIVTTNIYSPGVVVGLQIALEELRKQGEIEYKVISELEAEGYLDWLDVAVFVRTVDERMCGLLDKIKARGKQALYYVDDSLYDIPPSIKSGQSYRVKGVEQVLKYFIHNTKRLIACSPWLAKDYEDHYDCKAIWVTPVARRPSIQQEDNNKERIIIGFSGNADYANHLEKLKPMFLKLYARYRDRIQFEFCGAKVSFIDEIHGLYYRNLEYEIYEMLLARRRWDIGIAYSEETVFTKKKFYNKYLEYSRFGIAGVYSDVELFRRVIKEGHNGLLAANTWEVWYDQVERLIEEPLLREEVARAAKGHVLETFSVTKGAEEIKTKLKEFL